MWLCTKYGFYSIVIKEGSYQVRARERVDLDNLIREADLDCKVVALEFSDYQYRLLLDQDQYLKVMKALTDSVDYDNFKDMIHNRPDQQNKPYTEIWNILANKLGCYVGCGWIDDLYRQKARNRREDSIRWWRK